MTFLTLISFSAAAQLADSHGVLSKPASRAIQFQQNTTNGMKFGGSCPAHACEWYTQDTVLPLHQKTTICDPLLRTYGVHCKSAVDYPCTHGEAVPWCAPGTAPVASPCGVFGGAKAPVSGGRDMRDLPDSPVEKWTKGGVAKVAWAMTANHGGGYSYRLCPHGTSLSEECFQRHHLNFAGAHQQIIDEKGKVIGEKEAVRVSNGTHPAGSTWTQNPIPQNKGTIPDFPGLPDLHGRGPFALSIQDEVEVPKDLPAGPYVLSWRWDAEQTKQVWSGCSDIELVDADALAAAVKPVPEPDNGRYTPSGKHLCVAESFSLEVHECDAWVEVFDALGGHAWPVKPGYNWRVDPCGASVASPTWELHIVCSELRDVKHITEMYLLGEEVKGVVPASIGKFPQLQALSFVSTNIQGPLPATMGKLPMLSMLWLDHNKELGGSIPKSFTKLRLKAFELHRSNFSGHLPHMDFARIDDCHLEHGAFECPLPAGAAMCGAACKSNVLV